MTQHVGDCFLAVVEDVFELAADEEMDNIAKRFERQSVTDLVFDKRLFGVEIGKSVGVDPLAVWASELLIDEFCGRFPMGDLSLPAYGNPAHPQFIVDECPFLDRDRLGCDDMKL